MSTRRRRHVAAVFAATSVAACIALGVVSVVTADSGFPSSISVVKTGTLTVDASGNWSWPAMVGATTLKYGGYAIDWGDVTSGNEIGTYHIGDGTAATNVVIQPSTPDRGTSGTWGPVSHAYASEGSYVVCVIFYDLGTSKPFPLTGYHSLTAGGPDRNTDNSVDHEMTPAVQCSSFKLTNPTPSPSPAASPSPIESASPFESFQGETSNPRSTPPPTSTTGQPRSGSGLLVVVLSFMLAPMIGAVIVSRRRPMR